MSGPDDDRIPMLEYEMAVTSAPLDSKIQTPAAGAIQSRRRSVTLTLAFVTFIIFACALIFLVVSLIVPILHSLDAEHVTSNSTHHDDGHASEHHHGHRRSVQQLVDTLRQLAVVCRIFIELQSVNQSFCLHSVSIYPSSRLDHSILL